MSAYGDRRVSHSGLIPFFSPLLALSLPTTHHGRCRTGRYCFQPVLREFQASQFTADFIHSNPCIFVGLDWVHPARLRAFLHDRGMLLASARRDPVKSEAFEPSLRVHVKSEPRSDPDIIDLCTPLRPTAKTRVSVPANCIELSSGDELEVEEALIASVSGPALLMRSVAYAV
ncbi:hypothetical protein C8R45DRAFT_353859 [Mycena sanguinolenta]|nr:hypothetical protein C8R45DRAFT_353859 [Mycena sanguinolenta]